MPDANLQGSRIAEWLEAQRKKKGSFRAVIVTLDNIVADVQFEGKDIKVCRRGKDIVSVQVFPQKVHSFKRPEKVKKGRIKRPRSYTWQGEPSLTKEPLCPRRIKMVHPIAAAEPPKRVLKTAQKKKKK